MAGTRKNILWEKAYALAVKIIRECFDIQRKKHEYILTKQLIRSIWSVCANLEEAYANQSDRDCIAKLYISFKEARESHLWIRLMHDTGKLETHKQDEFCNEIVEVRKMLFSTIRTKKRRMWEGI